MAIPKTSLGYRGDPSEAAQAAQSSAASFAKVVDKRVLSLDGQVVPLAVDNPLFGLFILIGLTQVNGIFGNIASRKGIFLAPANEPANARSQV